MTTTPLFVLGRHRSGTTWLGNILASLPEVYAPAQAQQWGVQESAYFSHLVPHCNHGRTAADLRRIKSLFERSRYFSLTGLEAGPDILAFGIAGYFRAIMESGASAAGARYWLEKTPAHTLHAGYLARAFPDAAFVAVIRGHDGVVASNVHGFGDPASPASWFRQSAVTAAYEKIILRHRVHVVRYESLVSDYDATVRALLEALGIACGSVPQSGLPRNTSFREAPPPRLWWQSAAVALGRGVVLPLPAAVIEAAAAHWRDRRQRSLPPWFFASGAGPRGDAGGAA